MKLLAAILLSLLLAAPAKAAVSPDEMLTDPALESRARSLGKELRCLVCQNQSIDDSDADLAKDLRAIVRERLLAGDGDSEIKDYLVARYGDFVLLSPPVKASTYALWIGPFVIFVIGAGILLLILRQQRSRRSVDRLTSEEQQRIDRLMSG